MADRLTIPLPSNHLRPIRSFYRALQPVGSILPQGVAELLWGHHALLLEKLPEPENLVGALPSVEELEREMSVDGE